MSTKIYDGIKFKTNDLREIFAALDQFRDVATDWYYQYAMRNIAAYATTTYDKLTNNLLVNVDTTKSQDSVIFNAISYYWDQYHKEQKDPSSYTFWVQSFDVTIHPITSRKILGIPFSSGRELSALFDALPIVEPYGYWNNTDQEEGVTNRQWERRRLDWDIALPANRDHVPAFSGMVVECIRKVPIFPNKYEQFTQYIPSIEQRAGTLAANVVHQQVSKMVDLSASGWYSKWREAERSPEIVELRETVTRSFMSTLDDITHQTLIDTKIYPVVEDDM